MTSTPHVVLYGKDDALHCARRALLEGYGFAVSSINSLDDLNSLCQGRRVCMTIVCYTIKADESDEVVAICRATQSGIRIALLSAITAPGHPNQERRISMESSRTAQLPKAPTPKRRATETRPTLEAAILIENPFEFTRHIRTLMTQALRTPLTT